MTKKSLPIKLFILIDKYSFIVFLLALSAFKIPSFYLIPIIKNSLLTSQAIARILLVLIFIYLLIRSFIKSQPFISVIETNRNILILTLIFFCLQSLSVLSAINLQSFLERYKDIFVSFIAFFLFYIYRTKFHAIASTLIFGSLLNILYQFFIIFSPNFFINFISPYIYSKHALLVLANIDRGRIYADIYDEMVIPFLFLPAYQYRFAKLNLNSLFILLLSFFALMSNFRTRILMLVFSVGSSIIWIKKISHKMVFVITLLFFITTILSSVLLTSRYGYSFYDRFLLQDEYEDVSTITSRVEQVKLGLQLGNYSIFGIGLGNYYDHLPNQSKYVFSYSKWQQIESEGASQHIHNNIAYIIAESGYISGLVFIILSLLFLKNDFKILLSDDNNKKAVAIAFWTLYIHGLFNPIVPASYQILFWGMRGLLL